MRRKWDDVPRPWLYAIAADADEDFARSQNTGQRRSKSRGGVTTKDIMDAYDRLPIDLRAALARANHPWAPHWAQFVICWYPETAVIERICRADREEAQRRQVQLLLGNG